MHDHTCLIFDSTTEFFHCMIPFIREGIKNNEKCFVVIDEITREEVLSTFKKIFREGIIPPEELNNDKHIVIENFKNIYLPDGKFDMDRTISSYIKTVDDAIKDGYTGVRVFAEVSTFLSGLNGKECFLNWEAFADQYFFHHNFIAVCAYNKKYLASEDHISRTIKVHPIEIDIIKTRL